MKVGVQGHILAAVLPQTGCGTLFTGVQGGLQDRPGQARKISPPSGIDPRKVQAVESGYTD